MAEALVIIDVQNDFCPGGALAVAEGDAVVPVINALQGRFATRILTQDWHPADHSSFASNHDGAEPFSMIEMHYGPQVLWPAHCIQGTDGAAFHANLRNSDGLKPQKRKYIDIAQAPDRVKEIYDRVLAHYEHLYSHRLQQKGQQAA